MEVKRRPMLSPRRILGGKFLDSFDIISILNKLRRRLLRSSDSSHLFTRNSDSKRNIRLLTVCSDYAILCRRSQVILTTRETKSQIDRDTVRETAIQTDI